MCFLYLGFPTSALLHQTPRHGAGDGKCLEERADEVTQTQGYQFLKQRYDMLVQNKPQEDSAITRRQVPAS